ncbi:hypothetical protein A9K55_004920 [Cordyceps militaris]|uniref:Condensation domain-containing protein n=1 Tax=Cordyceps militaris TaxID=73501 RepID=A0A2H4SPU4_CORMI|nr:hypothetical protein A9K55_004920 [Cordyceps militaris]
MALEPPKAAPGQSTMSQVKSEWSLDLATREISRKLRGAELIVRAAELTNNGSFQLNILGEFETSIPKAELRKRCQTAWWLTRQSLPLVGVTLGSDEAFLKLLQSVDDAERWISETCLFEDNVTCEEVLLKQCRQISDVTTLTVILEPSSGRQGCVLNISHTLTSLDVYRIIDSFVSNLSARECDADFAQSFSPESATLLPRLPQSLSHAYTSQNADVTAAQRAEAMTIYERAQARWARPSIGIPIHAGHHTRASLMHNEHVPFPAALVAAALAAAKQHGVTLTALFFACITAGIQARYDGPPNGDEADGGAHLVFSGNAKRWAAIRASERHAPVGMSILPGALWLDRAELCAGPAAAQNVFALARTIQARQQQDLASQHIIGVYDELAPRAFQAAMGSSTPPPAVPAVSRPTLTSQGEFAKQAARGAAAARARLVHFRSGGRNTDPNVCFALYSFRGDMRCNLLFDGKYFDRDDVVGLMDNIMALFRRAAFSGQNTTSSKI